MVSNEEIQLSLPQVTNPMRLVCLSAFFIALKWRKIINNFGISWHNGTTWNLYHCHRADVLPLATTVKTRSACSKELTWPVVSLDFTDHWWHYHWQCMGQSPQTCAVRRVLMACGKVDRKNVSEGWCKQLQKKVQFCFFDGNLPSYYVGSND